MVHFWQIQSFLTRFSVLESTKEVKEVRSHSHLVTLCNRHPTNHNFFYLLILTMLVTPDAFLELAKRYVNSSKQNSCWQTPVSERAFKAHFRLSPVACAGVWERLVERTPKELVLNGVKFYYCEPSHLLWVLYHAWNYPTEEVGASFVGVATKTYRKYVYAVMGYINRMGWTIVSSKLLKPLKCFFLFI